MPTLPVRLAGVAGVLHLDRAVDVRRERAQLEHRAFAAQRDVHLIGVDARHHVRRRLADLDARNRAPVLRSKTSSL
jgi:hypothetical protein